MKHHRTALRLPEFIALMAVMVSTVALSTDIMLPALDVIGDELEVTRARDTQLVVTTLFFGFALGQIVVGPLSDHFGRRSIIHLGYAVFLFGCLLSITATSFNTMLVGRMMQGLGAAAPRIITLAIVWGRAFYCLPTGVRCSWSYFALPRWDGCGLPCVNQRRWLWRIGVR